MTAPSGGRPPDDALELDWAARAARVIPGGTSTGSKRPAALYGGEALLGPSHFVRASGCRVTTPGGRDLVDFTMALGAVALGYGDPLVGAAAAAAAADGTVAGLASVREVEVAERLRDLIPCAEQVRFLKSGAEAVAAAVRIARTCTGRDLVVGCGYFGWLDWWSEAAGVPAGARAGFRAVPYDDVEALEAAVAAAGTRLAAVVLEPVQERLPSPAWAGRARELCDAAGAVLVFDDMKTGFRLHPAGYQGVAGVRPDVAVFGKALANGFPLAAVVGRRDVMDAARRTWISSTLAGETVALAAAAVVLDRHAREDVCAGITAVGRAQLDIVRGALLDAGVADRVPAAGIPPMWLLRHADAAAETRTLQALVRRGVLLKRGAYNFPSLAHDDAALAVLAAALPAALREAYRA